MRVVLRVLSVFALGFSTPAWAYYALLDNGEILAPGKYKATGDLQILSETGGLNAAGRFDMGFQDEYGLRALVGVGKTDYFMGGFLKWMPIPDIEGQPAIGFNVGIVYGKDEDIRDLSFRLEPIVSKKFKIDEDTYLTPYGSLPVSIRQRAQRDAATTTYGAFQLIGGAQLQVPQWKNLQFSGEIGINLDNALAHLAVAAIYYFDGEK